MGCKFQEKIVVDNTNVNELKLLNTKIVLHGFCFNKK